MTSAPRIYVSSGAFGVRDFPAAIALARDWGLERIELSGGMAKSDTIIEDVKAAQGFDFLVHNYFPPPPKAFVLNLASEDPETLERSRNHVRTAVDLSQALGASHYSVHAGFAARVKPEHLGVRIPAENRTNKARAAQIFRESVRDLVDYGHERGVKILIENNVVEPANLVEGGNEMLLLAEADEIVEFMDEMGRHNLGMLVDLGHAYVSSHSLDYDLSAFCESVAPYTEALHLSDNDGRRDSNKPFDTSSWLVDAIGVFDPEYVVIEAYRISPKDVADCTKAIHAAFAG